MFYFLLLENLLWIQIPSSSFDNSGDMSCICLGDLFREAKVTNLGIHFLVQKDITALHITVYDSWFISIVQIVQSFKRNETQKQSFLSSVVTIHGMLIAHFSLMYNIVVFQFSMILLMATQQSCACYKMHRWLLIQMMNDRALSSKTFRVYPNICSKCSTTLQLDIVCLNGRNILLYNLAPPTMISRQILKMQNYRNQAITHKTHIIYVVWQLFYVHGVARNFI